MCEKKEILNSITNKISKFQFFLFVFIFLYIVIKLNSNTSINQLRDEKNKLAEIALHLNSLNKDYLNLCNLTIDEKQKISHLNRYFKYLYYNDLSDNKEILEGVIEFLQYILNKDEKSETLICPNEIKVKIKELVTFNRHLYSYTGFINTIQESHKSLFEEIKNHNSLKQFGYFTPEERRKILGGEDIFVAITGKFGEELQKTNRIEHPDSLRFELTQQASKLYYSYDDFSEITLSQLSNLLSNYEKYIDKVLENKMTEKNKIPFTDLSFEKNIFSKIVLFIIIILLSLLIIETIKLIKIENTIRLEKCNVFYNIFILLPKKIKRKFSKTEKAFLYAWSIIFIFITIFAFGLAIYKSFKIDFEFFLLFIYLTLYYIWLFLIYKTKNKINYESN